MDEQKYIPRLRFPEFLDKWKEQEGNMIFESVSNRKHNSDLPILAITQDHGAIPRDLIDYKVIVSDKSIETYKVVEKGDFIISLRSFQGGIEYSNYLGICSPAYIILKPLVSIEDTFFKYYFKTERYIRQLGKNLEGIRDGKMISFKYFSDAKLILPSILEQRKIASFLSTVDEKFNVLKRKKALLEQYKNGVMQQLFSGDLRFKQPNGKDFPTWEEKQLKDVVIEHLDKNAKQTFTEVFSVAKQKGVINQIEHLGRSFSAENISHYKLIYPNDIVYTKSPTSDFPFGIIKQNMTGRTGVVSPLYGVFRPKTKALGFILHNYFLSAINTYNYLNPLVQKGAKNTMNINNTDFLNGAKISLPVSEEEQTLIADFLTAIDEKINHVQEQLIRTEHWKKGLLQQLFC